MYRQHGIFQNKEIDFLTASPDSMCYLTKNEFSESSMAILKRIVKETNSVSHVEVICSFNLFSPAFMSFTTTCEDL